MRLPALVLLLLTPAPAMAGAWTAEAGSWQQITSLIGSMADRTYGTPAPIRFRKALLQTYTEHGWRDGVTVFLASESAYVEVTQDQLTPYSGFDNAIELGGRLRLHQTARDVVSLEASLRTAGAFNFAVAANPGAGGDGGRLRLLYGRSFQMFGRDAFVDIGLGRQFLSGDRADETGLDVTAGFWFAPGCMVMLQGFNIITGAGALSAYPAFRSHKLQLSWVRRLSPRFHVQAGGFFSPAGHNALEEQGAALSLWTRF
jgi:hypothetical protein